MKNKKYEYRAAIEFAKIHIEMDGDKVMKAKTNELKREYQFEIFLGINCGECHNV